MKIGDMDAHIEPDSGASANVMDEYQFKALQHRSQENNNSSYTQVMTPSKRSSQTFKS